jgi:hypothetical protein
MHQIKAKCQQAINDLGQGSNPALFNAVLANDDLEFSLGEFVFNLQNWYPNHDFDAIYLEHQQPVGPIKEEGKKEEGKKGK